MSARRVIIASGNAHKIEEIAAMFAAAAPELQVVGIKQCAEAKAGEALPDIEETATTFSGNAALKSMGYASWLRERGAAGDDLVLADDSGICLDALGGEPGVYSARFSGPDATDPKNNAHACARLAELGLEASPAHYACVLSLARVDGQPVHIPMPESGEGDMYLEGPSLCIEGHCSGVFRVESRGEGGFGYDPHFWVDEGARTFAELTPAAKAARSHRGAAMALLMDQLEKILAQDPSAG